MTREQARREIDSLDFYLQNHTDDYGEESHTAMMLAIEALKQEPTTTVLQEIREEIRKDAEWWSEHDSLREQVLRDVIEDIIDKYIGDME